MGSYEVEGTTLFHWKVTVAAQDEHAAVNGAPYRVASCVSNGPSRVTFGGLEHRVVRCEATDPEEQRRQAD